MRIREADLPGIGRKFEADLRGGERVVVVVHDDGRRELYVFEGGDPNRRPVVVGLDDPEARQLAGILGGMAYAPRALETVEMALGGLVVEWYRVEPGSPAQGKTIGELAIRQTYGATVVAITGGDRAGGGEEVINPGPEVVIGRGATLVVVGERRQVQGLKEALAPDAPPAGG